MRHVQLESAPQIREFRNRYMRRATLPLEEGYLESSFVAAFYNARGEMVGGYAIREGASRCFGFLPDESQRLALEALYPESETREVVCLWMDSSVKSLAARLKLYFWMYLDVIRQRPRYLVSASTIPQLQVLHRLILKNLCYDGIWFGTNKTGLIYADDLRFLEHRFAIALSRYISRQFRSRFTKLFTVSERSKAHAKR